MPESQDKKSYLDLNELVARTGLSEATIWRLKRAGKIPFFQPGGRGSRVKFPVDAIEFAGLMVQADAPVREKAETPERLAGPRPTWMTPRQNSTSK